MKTVLFMIVLVLLLGVVLFAQAPPSSPTADPYTPTEIQSLRLEVRYKDVQMAQMELNRALEAVDGEAKSIQKENGWPDTVRYDIRIKKFIAPMAQPAPASEKPVTPSVKPLPSSTGDNNQKKKP